eukprot:Gb_32703 [translate_table: standard]
MDGLQKSSTVHGSTRRQVHSTRNLHLFKGPDMAFSHWNTIKGQGEIMEQTNMKSAGPWESESTKLRTEMEAADRSPQWENPMYGNGNREIDAANSKLQYSEASVGASFEPSTSSVSQNAVNEYEWIQNSIFNLKGLDDSQERPLAACSAAGLISEAKQNCFGSLMGRTRKRINMDRQIAVNYREQKECVKDAVMLGKRSFCEESEKISAAVIRSSDLSPVIIRQRSSSAGSSQQIPRCQVEGCRADLRSGKDYHRRHKVCEMHSKASKVRASGLEQRFCQQCSRFHVLSEFDEGKRSCRRRLAGHNERRRKTQVDPSPSNLGAANSSLPDDQKRPRNIIGPFAARPLQFPFQTALMEAGRLPLVYTNFQQSFNLLKILQNQQASLSSAKHLNKRMQAVNVGNGLAALSPTNINYTELPSASPCLDRGSSEASTDQRALSLLSNQSLMDSNNTLPKGTSLALHDTNFLPDNKYNKDGAHPLIIKGTTSIEGHPPTSLHTTKDPLEGPVQGFADQVPLQLQQNALGIQRGNSQFDFMQPPNSSQTHFNQTITKPWNSPLDVIWNPMFSVLR